MIPEKQQRLVRPVSSSEIYGVAVTRTHIIVTGAAYAQAFFLNHSFDRLLERNEEHGNPLEKETLYVTYDRGSNEIFITTRRPSDVLVYSGDTLKPLRGWQIQRPDLRSNQAWSISCDHRGRIFVWSAWDDYNFDVYTRTGEHLRTVSHKYGIILGHVVASPQHEDEVFVTDCGWESIKVFDVVTGQLVREIGKGKLGKTSALTLDRNGHILVVSSDAKIKVVNTTGELIDSFGEVGRTHELLSYPTNICADSTGLIYIVDRDSPQVSVWSY